MGTERFDDVAVMEAFGGEVDALSARTPADHAGHGELGGVAERGGEARTVCFRKSQDFYWLFVLLQTGLFLLDHLLCGSDQGLHLAGLSRGCSEVVCVVTVTGVTRGAAAIGRTHHAVFIPVAPSCRQSAMVQI